MLCSLHASQHLITANYQRLPCVIWCVFFLLAISSNYTYIMSSRESLLHKASPGGSFSIGRRREMAHIHLDHWCSGQVNRPQSRPDQSAPVQAWLQTGIRGWHCLLTLRGKSDRRAANHANPNRYLSHLHPHGRGEAEWMQRCGDDRSTFG